MHTVLQLTGNDLTLEDVERVAVSFALVALSGEARERMLRSRGLVEQALESDAPCYGINTGLGRLSDIRIAAHELRHLQINLVRSHACGVGAPLPQAVVRAIMLLRANSLAKGYSGVRPVLVDRLCELLNRRIHPVVPEQGSVGASGDLAPLAHVALVLLGEGEVLTAQGNEPAQAALQRAAVAPLELAPKEGLSLLNGTQAMLGLGTLALVEMERLIDAADVIGALSLEALRGTPVAFDERIQLARGQPGQRVSAARLRTLLEGSAIRESHRACLRVQDAYSLRCMPQVHGAVRDSAAAARATFAAEANAAVDNPLVFEDPDGSPAILSGGNFHGQPLALALDGLAIALAALSGISERRLDRLVNPSVNEGLPPFLAVEPGLNSGFMMAQVTAAALAAEVRTLAAPASVHSIPTSGDKEDFVSMGMTAALKLRRALEASTQVLALELLAAVEAVEYLAPLETSAPLRQVMAAVRERVPRLREDRALSGDIARVAEWLRGGGLHRIG